MCLVTSSTVSAQVQRTFINLGFEQPDLGTNACYVIITDQQVPGWTTTHASGATFNSGCNGITVSPTTGPLIEIWANNLQGGKGGTEVVPARAGTQHAELNARNISRIYQDVCLTNGETVAWRLSHRGLNSNTDPDVMDFGINPAGNTATPVTTLIARLGTTANGTSRIDPGGTPSFAAIGTLVLGGTVNGWRDYTGAFTWTGATAVQQIGFSAVSAVGGAPGGNHLDDIQVTLTPYIELTANALSVQEGQVPTVQLRVIGTVQAGGITVPVTVTGGTATNGSDFTTGNVTIPAGTYDNNTFDVPLTVVEDNLIEDNETVVLTLQPNAAQYTLTSTTSCGATGTLSETVTILDDDVDVRTTQTVSNANPPNGADTTFTVTYQNNTARPTVGAGADLTAHDATVTLSDALPAGFTAFSWTCTASGTPAPTCPAPSGTGAITTPATLPAGNAGAAGGTLTYAVTATVAIEQCTAANNTSNIAIVAPFQESASAQAGFTTPAPGGATNNTASASIDPGCVTLNKSVVPAAAAGPFNFTLSSTWQTIGTATTPAGGTVQVDGANGAAGVNNYGILAPGAAVSINENAIPLGYTLANATCTGPLGATGALAGTTITIPAGAVTAGADFTCTFTNVATGTIVIVKNAIPDNPQDFAFTTTGPGLNAFNLDDDADGTLPNTQTFTNLVPGTYTVTEGAMAGWDLSNIICTDPDGGTTFDKPARTATFDLDSGETVTCTFENKSLWADLSITNTNTPGFGPDDQPGDTVARGQALTYALVITNNGPSSANNALVRDTPTGVNCPPANVVTCTGAGTCPGATVGQLTGAGVTLPSLAAGSSITMTFGCTVP
jgi:uncharacterized repeat protein (TIGR01451 family)